MTLKCTGSRSMNMAPVSSFKLEILPDKREVKKVSGTTVRVALRRCSQVWSQGNFSPAFYSVFYNLNQRKIFIPDGKVAVLRRGFILIA